MTQTTEFAPVLRRLMKEGGITQTALASHLGITAQAVNLWCSGKTMPDYASFLQVCSFFGVTADYMLTGRQPDLLAVLGLDEKAYSELRKAMKGDYGPIAGALNNLLGNYQLYAAMNEALNSLNSEPAVIEFEGEKAKKTGFGLIFLHGAENKTLPLVVTPLVVTQQL